MGFQGKFRDLSLVDILQVVQMTQKSGILEIYEGARRASVLFRNGNIVDARPSGVGRLSDDLLSRGLIPAAAKAELDADEPGDPSSRVRIGERLVQKGWISAAKLREVLIDRVESTIYETLGWINGSFDFDIADAAGNGPALLALEDVLPGVNFDTQQVLMDALRVFDERQAGRPPAAPESEAPVAAERPAPTTGPRVLVVGPDAFRERMRLALLGLAAERREFATVDESLGWIAAEPSRPLLLLLYVDDVSMLAERIAQARIQTRHLEVITASDDPAIAVHAATAGAWAHVGILPSDPGPALAYLQTLVAARVREIGISRAPAAAPSASAAGPLKSFSSEIATLRDRLDSLAREVNTASVTMRILEFVAERLERGLVFLVRPNDLQGLGAFGNTAAGDPIGPLVSELRLPLAEGSLLRRAIEGRQSVLCEPDREAGLEPLYERIGRPDPADILLIPLTSVGQSVALIYADNGSTGRRIAEFAELDVLAQQAGLALENSLLRRILEKRRASGISPERGGT